MTPPINPPILVRGLSKSYGDVVALDELSFEVRRGEIFGLLGPNGAGKTTALQILLGILRPDGGEAEVLGLSPAKDRGRLAPRVNFSSAYTQLPSNLTVSDDLSIFAGLYGVSGAREKIAGLLDTFRLSPRRRARAGSLSSGEQTRLNLCKALLNDPEVLFLDEPTASLDPDISDLVRGQLRTLQRERGLTVLYTSHNMAEVEDLCDRVLFLHKGRNIAEGTPAEIRERFKKDSLEKVFIHLARGGELTDPSDHDR